MTIITSLTIGVSALIIVFLALKIMTPIKATGIAIIEAFISMGLYIPYAILQWRGVDVFSMHVGIFLITCSILAVVGRHWDKRDKKESFSSWFHWAPASVILFFVVLVIVDSFFVTVATQGVSSEMAKWLLPEPQNKNTDIQSHFPGVVERDYRRKDSDYIDYQKKLLAQQKLGWVVHRGWLNRDYPKVGEKAVFQVQVVDQSGQPVKGVEINGSFLRLSNHKKDVHFKMTEVADGLFQYEVILTEPGRWNVYLRLSRGDDLYESQSNTEVW